MHCLDERWQDWYGEGLALTITPAWPLTAVERVHFAYEAVANIGRTGDRSRSPFRLDSYNVRDSVALEAGACASHGIGGPLRAFGLGVPGRVGDRYTGDVRNRLPSVGTFESGISNRAPCGL